MTRRNHDIVEVRVRIRNETDKAVLASPTGDERDAEWVPKSQIEIEWEHAVPWATLQMPEWLAQEKGFI